MTSRVYVDPRRLDRRVRIERKRVVKGASGGMSVAWSLVGVRWAGIKSKKTGDKVDGTNSGGGKVADATHEIELYYLDGLSPTTHRIVHGPVVYDLMHVDDVFGQGVKMIVQAKTGVSNG